MTETKNTIGTNCTKTRGYKNGKFTNSYTLYPDITNISVYSTNTTLPNEDYYYYRIDEVEAFDRQVEEAESAILSFETEIQLLLENHWSFFLLPLLD